MSGGANNRARCVCRIVVRKREKGLSSAVLAGFNQATYNTLMVMDADLSHPPEAMPLVAAPIFKVSKGYFVEPPADGGVGEDIPESGNRKWKVAYG
jgi:dolichol-phosphate mannosyltransferase